MTHRLLPPDEWPRLADTPQLGPVWAQLPVASASVLVVEDGDRIVGTWAFLHVLHAEGVYVDPAHRGRGAVARHLWRGMREIARLTGAAAVWTGANTDDVAALLLAHGATKFPVDSYVLPLPNGVR